MIGVLDLGVLRDMTMRVERADKLSDQHVGIHVPPREFEEVRMVKQSPHFELSRESLGTRDKPTKTRDMGHGPWRIDFDHPDRH